ncbi:outer membrane protein assembly factor BamD [bacterium]|nr:outer membrane protein assembly factor BamD [bacterium]
MKVSSSVYAALMMTICACFALWRGEKEFSYDKELQNRLHLVAKKLQEEKLKSEVVLSRFYDFKQEVALALGEQKNLTQDQNLRDLASVIPHHIQLEKNTELASRNLFDVGYSAFQDGEYDKAIQKLLDTVSKYPDSSKQLEACYYLVRSFYITGNKQEALSWSEKMLRQFPDSPWTAKSMIVMAHIYMDQNRKNDALDVYQTVLNTFKETEIQDEVKKQLIEMGL